MKLTFTFFREFAVREGAVLPTLLIHHLDHFGAVGVVVEAGNEGPPRLSITQHLLEPNCNALGIICRPFILNGSAAGSEVTGVTVSL